MKASTLVCLNSNKPLASCWSQMCTPVGVGQPHVNKPTNLNLGVGFVSKSNFKRSANFYTSQLLSKQITIKASKFADSLNKLLETTPLSVLLLSMQPQTLAYEKDDEKGLSPLSFERTSTPPQHSMRPTCSIVTANQQQAANGRITH